MKTENLVENRKTSDAKGNEMFSGYFPKERKNVIKPKCMMIVYLSIIQIEMV